MRDLRGKRVLITGGAGGIGTALALRFASEGAELLLTDIDDGALARAAATVQAAGATVWSRRADVTDPDSIRELRDAAHREGGPIDVLVNNAGVVFGGSFLGVPLDRHLATYRVNTLGLVAVTHVFLPDLIARPEGHLVNVASASGLIGLPYGSTYASSKWSVIGFSESLRLELEQQGQGHVKVTTVCPSYVAGELFEGATPPRATRLLRPETLAARVVAAVRRDRAFLLTPWLVKLTPVLRGLLPVRLFDALSRLFGATAGMEGWRGRDHGAGPDRPLG